MGGIDDLGGDGAVDGGGFDGVDGGLGGVEWWRRSMASMVAWMASKGVDGGGFDGVDGGLDGVEWRRWVASMVGVEWW